MLCHDNQKSHAFRMMMGKFSDLKRETDIFVCLYKSLIDMDEL